MPEDIFNNLLLLNDLALQNNNLNDLPKYIFNNLVNLKLLYLNRNILESITFDIFAPLVNLVELRLDKTYNRLTADMFSSLPHLIILKLK